MFTAKSNFVFVLIGAAFFISNVASQTFTMNLGGKIAQPDVNCTEAGRICNGCKSVAYCIGLPTGAWIKEELFTCESNTTCLDSTKECSDKPNPKCESIVANYTFNCYQTGTFPDPFDCTKYHICVPKDSSTLIPQPMPMSYKCGIGYSYDPLSTTCRNKLVNGTCTPLGKTCVTPGQVGGIAGNPSQYYICLKSGTSYFPQMFNCPFAEKFNGVKCVDSTPPAATDVDGKCNDKRCYSDPTTCKGYMECTAKGVLPIRRVCYTGYKFDYALQKCVEFTC